MVVVLSQVTFGPTSGRFSQTKLTDTYEICKKVNSVFVNVAKNIGNQSLNASL